MNTSDKSINNTTLNEQVKAYLMHNVSDLKIDLAISIILKEYHTEAFLQIKKLSSY